MVTELASLETRVTLIEEVLNSVQQALLNVASRESVSTLLVFKEQDVADLKTLVTSLQAQIDLLRAEVYK